MKKRILFLLFSWIFLRVTAQEFVNRCAMDHINAQAFQNNTHISDAYRIGIGNGIRK
ncbi:MAG: hypothetical protein R2807_04870 [Chitinophagales bacterium]